MTALLITITAVSMAIAAASTLIAWRAVRESRQISQARVAVLAEAIRSDEPPDSRPVALTHLLDDVQPTQGRQGLTVVAAAAAALAVVLALGRVAGGGASARAEEPPDAATATVRADVGPPASIDLVSLTHELGSNGQLELRGEVRNGATDANMEQVQVVALLFDRQGAYLSSGRAALQPRATTDGQAATFLVTVPDGSRVGRYRVSFRAGEHVVPHVDRRQSPLSDTRSAVP